jgi:tetratricopeptide (TPR) repeat protein
MLATARDARLRAPDEAIRLATKANELAGDADFSTLDTLAAAYASAGRFDEAASTEGKAVALASARQSPDQANKFRARLSLYRSHKSLVDK